MSSRIFCEATKYPREPFLDSMPVYKNQKDARTTALFILNTLDKGHKTLDGILEDVLGSNGLFTRRDRALLHALIYGVLRWRAFLDWIIENFSNTPIRKIDPRILNILRLGVFQIIFMDRIPVSAAVNTAVEMSKSVAPFWVVRFVNALLRNTARGYKTVPFPDPDKDPVSAIAIRKSFPKWLIKRWIDRLGFNKTEKLCDALNAIPPITIRTNMLRTTRGRLMKSLEDLVERIHATVYSPDGISFFNPITSIPEMPAFKNGWFQVQDEAAQLATCLLDPQPGETVLDACAGLGGKTGHIAQMMDNTGCIVAIDKNPEKLVLLESEMDRLGVSIVDTCRFDLKDSLSGKNPGMFDRILLDAPCSGLGVLRRNPDSKWFPGKKDLNRYRKQQILFLDNVAHFVKPTGILNYTVCSSESEENEQVVEDFLRKHPEFFVFKPPESAHGSIMPLIDRNGYLRTSPALNNMDGFFSVNLKRLNHIASRFRG